MNTMKPKTISERCHVISSGKRWAVKRSGAKRASSVYDHREVAYHHARLLADNVVVHRKDGSVEFMTCASKT